MKSDNLHKWLDLCKPDVACIPEQLLMKTDAMREEGIEIYPLRENIFKSLELVAPEDVKVVIIGQDPYHEEGQAMGLSFSVPAGIKFPPSLRNIYKELCAEYEVPMPVDGDLTSWAKQGVLMMNTVLTVQQGKANSHAKLGWQAFTGDIIRICLEQPQPVVFVGWGVPAINLFEKIAASCNAVNWHMIKSTHPSPLSASRGTDTLQAFVGSRPFGKINEILIKNSSEPINWLEGMGYLQF